MGRVKTKKSVATLTGFKCHQCNVENVTYDKSIPKICLMCGSDRLQRVWQDIVHDDVVVETVPSQDWEPKNPEIDKIPLPPGGDFSHN